jgi:hypothetical protein
VAAADSAGNVPTDAAFTHNMKTNFQASLQKIFL